MKLSLQDTNKEVLENIDRPEIPWEEHKEYITDFIKEFPEVRVSAELILGMPGQTLDNFLSQIAEFERLGIYGVIAYFWELLPNSPAYTDEYRRKFKLKNTELVVVDNSDVFETVEQVMQTEAEGGIGLSHCIYVSETCSCDFNDIIALKYISALYTMIKEKNSSEVASLKCNNFINGSISIKQSLHSVAF